MTNGTIYATIILVALWCGYLLIVKTRIFKKTDSICTYSILVGETVISAVTGIPLNQENGNYKENFPHIPMQSNISTQMIKTSIERSFAI